MEQLYPQIIKTFNIYFSISPQKMLVASSSYLPPLDLLAVAAVERLNAVDNSEQTYGPAMAASQG
jgi:hypothetical protein